MPHHPNVEVSGVVIHMFAHRFVVQTDSGAVLADLTPHGAERVTLAVGDRVALHGERKPSEIKVSRISRGSESVTIEHGDKHGAADPASALEAVRSAEYTLAAEPRRKPKHFEILGRRGKQCEELHVEFDGRIRKTKPAGPHEPKWRETMPG